MLKIDKERKFLPMLLLAVGFVIMMCQWLIGLNLIAIIGALYCCIVSALVFISIVFKKKFYLGYYFGYLLVIFGIATFYIVNGADAGWGAITTGITGFESAAHQLWQGDGNFGTRLIGNIIICSPSVIILSGVYLLISKCSNKKIVSIVASAMSIALMGTSVFFVFTMNLRSNPKAFDMSQGEADYLNNIAKTSNGSPNVLVILMDDLGYGDTSLNGAIYDTPNIDSIGENGLNFTNYYASYSVCSPSRFALLTGRYPYRGYADNVIYPTVNTFVPFAATRVFNSIELGANVDGMLGDEVTMAEAFNAAGYATGAFGKWHLGDYGQYLPTNQGFDYFYGSHHVNDMTPFYHATETDGNYTIAKGTESLDQREATVVIHNEIYNWIEDKADNDESFFAYYATPWPHAPIYAGTDYQGSTGMGIYADCVTEFDAYLGQLFDMMEEKGVLDDTIIIFTSDNGPALQGSTNELRGGKYTAYEGGQKVPFYIRWDNGILNGYNIGGGYEVAAQATNVDIFPTLAEMCGITKNNGDGSVYLPSDVDREIDGVSMVPLFNDKENEVYIHDINHPILYMKRESIKSVSYSMTKEDAIELINSGSPKIISNFKDNRVEYTVNAEGYKFITENNYTTWKYFKSMSNDNPAFPDKVRKNWLICLTDDTSESYQRADVFPEIASEAAQVRADWTNKLSENRRGIINSYYQS